MKKKLISLILCGVMAFGLVSCGDGKEKETSTNSNKTTTSSSESSSNSKVDIEENDNNEKEVEDSKETVKITEEEAKKINENNIINLKEFFEKNGLPYKSDNLYNKIAEETDICLYDREVEEKNIDTKDIKATTYYYMEDSTVQASISFIYRDGFDLTTSLASNYCEAIVGEKVDFSQVGEKLKRYFENYNSSSGKFSENIEIGKYNIEIKTSSSTGFIVNIDSTYQIK